MYAFVIRCSGLTFKLVNIKQVIKLLDVKPWHWCTVLAGYLGSQIRDEWGGGYECGRKHLLLSDP
jgi:hypothetical protein